jgi:hypothetical protein
MTKRLPCRFLALFALALAVALPAAALGAAGDVSTDVESLVRQYREVRPSVWQRATLDGGVEHLAVGPEGLAWALTQLHEQSNRELEIYLREPSAERWQLILDLSATMEQMRADITEARPLGLEEALGAIIEQAELCGSYSIAVAADAYPLNPGAAATSSASWWNTCGELGYVYCYAYAEVDDIHDSESKSGSSTTSVSRSCFASVSGSGDCYSYAYAYVYIPELGIYVSISDTNHDCGSPPPLSASLSCVHGSYPNFQCTGSASNGSPPYEAYWKIGSGSEYEDSNSPGTGPWNVNLICKYQSPGFQPYPVRFRVVDSAGAEKTLTRWCNGLVP